MKGWDEGVRDCYFSGAVCLGELNFAVTALVANWIAWWIGLVMGDDFTQVLMQRRIGHAQLSLTAVVGQLGHPTLAERGAIRQETVSLQQAASETQQLWFNTQHLTHDAQKFFERGGFILRNVVGASLTRLLHRHLYRLNHIMAVNMAQGIIRRFRHEYWPAILQAQHVVIQA